MLNKITIAFSTLIVASSVFAAPKIERVPAPKDATVYIISPADGETVKSPVVVKFGLVNMGVAPAGTKNKLTGHHHLVIDHELPNADQPIPADANVKHFGGGQTETTLDLPKGTHTLQLILGDDKHVSFEPVIASKKITITIQ
jgi:hypothetical protein